MLKDLLLKLKDFLVKVLLVLVQVLCSLLGGLVILALFYGLILIVTEHHSFLGGLLFGLIILLLILPIAIIILIAAPCLYFSTSHHVYGAGSKQHKLYEKYQEEAVHLRGVVLKRWTTKSNSSNDDTRTHHHIQVIYKIHQERYIKEFQVSPTAYLERRHDLLVLPLYPRSAILVQEKHSDSTENWFGIYWSLFWSWGWNIMFVHMVVNSIVTDAWLAWAIVACQVVVVWIAGYFIVRALSNNELRNTLFGANRIISNKIIPQEEMPKLTYQEMFPSTNITFCSIIQMMTMDFAKGIGLLLGFAVVLVYFYFLGGGYLLMKPFIVDRKMKQLFADYRVNGIHLRAESKQEITSNKLKIQYDATQNDFLSPTVQRYEKILPNPFQQASYFRQTLQQASSFFSDNPQIIVLKDVLTSAQFEDEIEMREKYYETGLYGLGFTKIFLSILAFVLQIAFDCSIIDLNFPNIPIIATATICVSVQIVLGYASASFYFRYLAKDILHNAKNVPIEECKVKDCEGNIGLASSPLDDIDGCTNVTDPISLMSNEDDWTLSGTEDSESSIEQASSPLDAYHRWMTLTGGM